METVSFRTGVIRAGSYILGEQCCVRKNWQNRISISAILHQHDQKHLCTGYVLRNYNVRNLQISLHCFPTAYISSAYSHLYTISEIKRGLSTESSQGTGFPKLCWTIHWNKEVLEIRALLLKNVTYFALSRDQRKILIKTKTIALKS